MSSVAKIEPGEYVSGSGSGTSPNRAVASSSKIELDIKPDITQDVKPKSTKRARTKNVELGPGGNGEDVKPVVAKRARGKGKKVELPPGETRTARWRKQCPVATGDRLYRVMHQRMFMLDRSGRQPGSLVEDFKVLGSTGNVYTVRIGPRPQCDCPDARNGNIPCKHIIFVFIKVLKLAPTSESWYQKSLLDAELQQVYETAPASAQGAYEASQLARTAWLKATGALPQDEGSETIEAAVEPSSNRKDAIGEDCPVCYEEMTEDDASKKLLVWDESLTGCGKALHDECFRNWTASIYTREGPGAKITCVWCRTPWPTPTPKAQGSGGVGYSSGGYMNLADMVGISRTRDISTYWQGPIRGQAMHEGRYADH